MMTNTENVARRFRSTEEEGLPEDGSSAFSGCCAVQGYGWREVFRFRIPASGGQCQPLIHEKVRRQIGVQPAAFNPAPRTKQRIFP